MTIPSSGSRPDDRFVRFARFVTLTGAVIGLVLGVTGFLVAGAGSAAAFAEKQSVVSFSGTSGRSVRSASGDDGRRSFGVQPAGKTAPDKRPNFTYQNVKPGQRLLDHVAFVNVSAEPVTLTVYPADGYTTESGGFDLLTAERSSKDIGTWVRMRRTKAVVPARSALVTPIEIRVPRNVEPGDHAGGIVASLKTLAKDSRGNTVTVDQRVGTRMYLRVAGKLTPKIELVRNQATYLPAGNHLGRGDVEIGFTIRNTGNVRLVGTRSIRVSDLFGSSAQAVGVPEFSELLPGGSVAFTTRVRKVLPTMLLTAHVTVDPRSVAGNVDPAMQQATASTRFWALYRPLLVLLVFALGEGARRWWQYRRRRTDLDPASVTGPKAPQPRTPVVTAVVLALGLLLVMVPATADQARAATDTGSLTFVPATGQDISPMYAVTSTGCPAPATNLIGRLTGKGFGRDGTIVIPNSDAALEHDTGFGVPLQDTLSSFAAEAGVTLNGTYTITVQCVDELATRVYAEFSGKLTFAGPKKFTAPAPKTPPAVGVPIGFLAQTFPEFKAGSGPSPNSSAPAPSVSAAPAAGSPSAAVPTAPGVGAQEKVSDLTPFAAILIAAVLLGLIGFVATRSPAGRSSGRGAGGSGVGGSGAGGSGARGSVRRVAATVSWPDEDVPVGPGDRS